ncbi:hypothetical protein [Methylovirgula sp. 4M-Z18]|uniref:hypothetical protein n=1 Tax=Methylovirgula sp. 4M-Z18 TaxID=2293567 RepID=UPI000E2F18A9|nr:hypothetical protein [Methylovirgula sp. 4M-Z18]RFB80406.1 hypothetical protein DYH55_02440 [Methylovirgula sp. 4M-Z18]
MIFAWPDVQKAPTDIKIVHLDWSTLLDPSQATATIVGHDASSVIADDVGDLAQGPPGLAGVVAADAGVSGFIQSVNLSGGMPDGFTVVSAHIVLDDGTDLTRSLRVLVR